MGSSGRSTRISRPARSGLTELKDESDSSLTEMAQELQRVETLRPRLEEAGALREELEVRARELRTTWLLRQADEQR